MIDPATAVYKYWKEGSPGMELQTASMPLQIQEGIYTSAASDRDCTWRGEKRGEIDRGGEMSCMVSETHTISQLDAIRLCLDLRIEWDDFLSERKQHL